MNGDTLAERRLAALLHRAVAVARARHGPEATADHLRGLFVTAEHAEDAIAAASQPYGAAAAVEPSWQAITAAEPSWHWVRSTCHLTDFDLDVVLLALAPELDAHYQAVFGYLQGDAGRTRPTVGLALQLLTGSAAEKRLQRARFHDSAALLRHQIVRVTANPRDVAPPRSAQLVVVDEQIADVLLGLGGLDPRLRECCELLEGDPIDAAGEQSAVLRRLLENRGGPAIPVYLQGRAGVGRRAAVAGVAAASGMPVLVVDLAALAHLDDTLLPIAVREAALHKAVLYLDGLDAIRERRFDVLREHLGALISQRADVTFLAGSRIWEPLGSHPLGAVVLEFCAPTRQQRRDLWSLALVRCDLAVSADDIDTAAALFALTRTQITAAAAAASHQARLLGAQTLTSSDLAAAARLQTRHRLSTLAVPIQPNYGWDDIVLPADTTAQLEDICARVTNREQVLGEWGFGDALAYGRGVTALFAGPPGTGKTMAAEVIARALGIDLYKIDLAAVVSKYIGETEKNLEEIFTAATDANAILFFDEADALFGKRSTVRDAHDRYANIEIAYLLQRMERYDGVAILATNQRENLDEAFTRRLAFVVDFPVPGDSDRERIWRIRLPRETPQATDIDFAALARAFRLPGGNITNIVVAAAYAAAAEHTDLAMRHLLAATHREYRKMARIAPAFTAEGNGAHHV